MPDKKQTRPKKTEVQIDVENLLNQPPLISLLNHAQSMYSTNPSARLGIDTGGMVLSGGKGLPKLAGRTLAEGPMYHDELITSGRTLTPRISPRYRTNKVGEQVLQATGNLVKDTLSDFAVQKLGAKFGPAGIAAAQKGLGVVNAITDPIVFGELKQLAGYMQKSRPELGGKSVFQSIPGFEEWLTEQANKNIADNPMISSQTIWSDPNENKGNKLDSNMVALQLMKLFNPKMAPPTDVDSRGRLDWQANKPSLRGTALNGDFNYASPGLSDAQRQGASIMDLAEIYDLTMDDIYAHPAVQEYAKLSMDIANKGYPKTIAHRLGNTKIKTQYNPDQSHLKPTKRNSTGQLMQP